MYNCTIYRSILLLLILFLCTPALNAIDTNDSEIIGNDKLDFADFGLLAKYWMDNCTEPQWCQGADLDSNQTVNMADLEIFTGRWIGRHNPDIADYLVGQWKFDEYSSLLASDSSGNNSSASLNNGPMWTNQRSLSFDGTDDYVDCGSGARLNLTGSLTLSSWIYPETFGGNGLGRIIDKHGNSSGFAFYVKEDTKGIAYLTYAGSYINSDDNVINLNQWQHVAVTYDDASDTVAFYVNGHPAGGGNYQTNPNDSADASFIIGNKNSLDNGFKGLISDTRVYNRALTAEEITTIYFTSEVRENKLLTFGITATDHDGNVQNFTVKDPQNLPAGAIFFDNIFAWRPWYDQAGKYEITVEAPDQSDPALTIPITVENAPLSPWYQQWLDSTIKASSFMEDNFSKSLAKSLQNKSSLPRDRERNTNRYYYTWGISDDQMAIPAGSLITEAILKIYGLASIDENINDTLAIYLLDNPPLDFSTNLDSAGIDLLAGHGLRLAPDYHETVSGARDLTFRFSRINNPYSWIWEIFENPFVIELADSTSVNLSSSLLELIDYAGNGTPFGIGLDIDSNNNFNFTGITLELTIDSFQGAPARSVLKFQHGDTNHPPVMEDIPITIDIQEGSILTFSVNATDPDDDEITYSVINLPEGASFENRIFEWTPSYDLSTRDTDHCEFVTFTASDGKIDAWQPVRIKVINTNRNPILEPIGNKTVSENENLSFSVSAIDPDGDRVVFGARRLPPGAILENNVFSWTPGFDQAQNYIVLISALDEQNAVDVETVMITVINTNRPPVFDEIPNQTIDENNTLTFQVSATDPDGDKLTYSVDKLPPNSNFNTDTMQFTWITAPGQAGNHNITFIVSDEQGLKAELTVNITVNPTHNSS